MCIEATNVKVKYSIVKHISDHDLNILGPHLSTVRTHRCVRNKCVRTVSHGIYQLVLMRRNVCKYKYTSEHAYAANLEVE